jgi:SAM-dependent methyltransferase
MAGVNPPLCAVCGSGTRRAFSVETYWIRACVKCSHEQAELVPEEDHVERTYSDVYFFGGGTGYDDYLRDGELRRRQGVFYGSLLRNHMPDGTRVFDVGAAAGFVMKGLEDAGWRSSGIEPNPTMVQWAHERLGVDVRAGSLETWQGAEQYDAVTMVQVIGHFVNPASALQAAGRLTRPGGLLLIESWNRESWTRRICGRHWQEYSPPSVLHWFGVSDLKLLCERHGFREVARGYPRKLVSMAHIKSLLRSKAQAFWLARWALACLSLVPDRMTCRYPGDDLCWILFRNG